jgi:nucleoside-diphosphate-sugar epimerase
VSRAIAIAGGAGFLGSHLCDYYIRNGDKVVCIDNLCTGSLNNITHLKGEANFTFVKADIIKILPPIITNKRYDVVVNLASPASPPHYQRLAVETLMVGSIGTRNLLELSRTDKTRFFQASTSEVYGDPDVHPQPESYRGNVNCYGPRSMYDEAKRFGEALVYSYRRKYNVSTAVARFFNTYGPRMDPNDGRVVSNLIVQALKNKPLTIYGKGTQTRSFCYVDDLINGIVKLIDSNEEGPMNIGNPGEFTILELAKTIQELTGSTADLVYKPLPEDDPLQRKPVIDLATTKLDWTPKVALRDGLIRTIDYFRTIS